MFFKYLQRIRQYEFLLVTVVFFTALLLAYVTFFPGAMTKDSVVQLYQATTGDYSDWHPPIMAFVWRVILHTPLGLGGMLFFQLLMLWSACFCFYIWGRLNNYRYSIVFLFIPLFPWVINFEFVIWKDVGLAYSWLLSIGLALIYDQNKKHSIFILFLIIAFFIYGFLVRGNAAAAAVFLLPFLAAVIMKRTSIKIFFMCLVTVVLTFYFLPKLTNHALSASNSKPMVYLMMDDVVALKLKGKGVEDSVFSINEIDAMRNCSRLQRNKVGAGICNISKMKHLVKYNYADLKTEWITVISDNPIDYVLYRLSAFREFLRMPMDEPYYASEFSMKETPYYIKSPQSFHELKASKTKPSIESQMIFSDYFNFFLKTFPFLFKPYSWLICAIATSVLLYRKRGQYKVPFWMLPLSGITYMAGYVLLTQAPDLRYAYWLVLICTLSLILLLLPRQRLEV